MYIAIVIVFILLGQPSMAQLYAPEIKVQDTETRVVATNGSGGSTLLRGDRLAVYQGEGSVVSFGGSYLNINRNNRICGAMLTFQRRGGTDWSIKNSRDDCGIPGGLHFLNSGRATRMSILQNGYVGIGYSNPAYALQVYGQVASYGTVLTSDERLKSDITDYSTGLAMLKQVKVKKYKYKAPKKAFKTNEKEDGFYEKNQPEETLESEDDFYSQEQIGVLAQQIQQIAPDLVGSYLDEEGEEIHTINHSAFTYLLINAIQEQQASIEQLQKELEGLKKAKGK